MLLLASALRGIRRLVIAATALALVAITWTIVLRLAAAPTQGRLSGFLGTLGTTLLRPFDSLGQSIPLSNAGTLSWTSFAALIVYALLGAAISWLLVRAAEGLTGIEAATQGPFPRGTQESGASSPDGSAALDGGHSAQADGTPSRRPLCGKSDYAMAPEAKDKALELLAHASEPFTNPWVTAWVHTEQRAKHSSPMT